MNRESVYFSLGTTEGEVAALGIKFVNRGSWFVKRGIFFLIRAVWGCCQGFWGLNAFFGLKLGFESKNYANLAKKLLPLRSWTIIIKSLVISINGCQS